jgi:hypothetical protein
MRWDQVRPHHLQRVVVETADASYSGVLRVRRSNVTVMPDDGPTVDVDLDEIVSVTPE